jgi:hypothetical protein
MRRKKASEIRVSVLNERFVEDTAGNSRLVRDDDEGESVLAEQAQRLERPGEHSHILE